MQSILELNKNRKNKLQSVLKSLFPEYKFINIKNNGFIIFKKNRLSFGYKIHLFELLFTELLKRLSNYRYGSNDYLSFVTDEFTDIVTTKNKNLVDSLYKEFLNIKKSSKTELIIERTNKALSARSTVSVIIDSFKPTIPKQIILACNKSDNFIRRITSLENKRSKGIRFTNFSLL